MKLCCRCKLVLPASGFHKEAAKGDGLRSFCKSCSRKLYLSQAEKHRKRGRLRMRRLRQVAEFREQERTYRKVNNESIKTYHRGWYSRNVERCREFNRRSRRNNLDTDRAKSARRRARIAGNGGNFTPGEWRDLKHRSGNSCLCCGRKDVALQADHVIPISKGGTNDIGNIQPLCGDCNKTKRQSSTDYRGAA